MKKHSCSATFIALALGVALNLALVALVTKLNVPVYLDCLGTILAAALFGPFPGVVVGFLSNCITSLGNLVNLYYGILSILIAVAAAELSRRGMFRTLKTSLVAVPIFAVLGGSLGSLITYMLSGLSFGTGVSAPYAYAIYNATGLPVFWAQLLGDTAIDIADKLITVAVVFFVLKCLPEKLLRFMPLGALYMAHPEDSLCPPLHQEDRSIRHSLRSKVTVYVVLTALLISTVAVTLSFRIFRNSMDDYYSELGRSSARLVANVLDGDELRRYRQTGVSDSRYDEIKHDLTRIHKNVSKLKYLYVYSVESDGCHVLFDLDTPHLPGEPLGALVSFDEDFKKCLPELLAGKDVEPVISHGKYGWLLTAYKAVHASDGTTAAYAAVDIDMSHLVQDQYTYIARIVCVLFGAVILLMTFSLWHAQQAIVDPIDSLSAASSKFAYGSRSMCQKNVELLKNLEIHTGDEIEKLYHAIEKTTSDAAEYIGEITEKTAVIDRLQDNLILSFADMVESRDENTGNHIRRTAYYVRLLCEELAKTPKYSELLSQEFIDNMVRSAPLHDIGKICIPDDILNKPGRLTPEEFDVIKTHTTAGRDILKQVFVGIENENHLSQAINMAYSHHERWDGRGYPAGLSGEDIPLCARIMAVADVFDALLSKRSYKVPFPFDDAVKEIHDCAGGHFDPEIAQAFLNVAEKIRPRKQ